MACGADQHGLLDRGYLFYDGREYFAHDCPSRNGLVSLRDAITLKKSAWLADLAAILCQARPVFRCDVSVGRAVIFP
jgi:hypothetical protein